MSFAAAPAAGGAGFALGGLVKGSLVLGSVATLTVTFSALTGAGGQAAGYPQGSGIPEVYWPMYAASADHYEVNPYLLASIHKIETDFGRSSLSGVSSKWNGCGAAGPMQFGIVGVAPYHATVPDCEGNPDGAGPTWNGYKDAWSEIASARPATYPLSRRDLGSCERVLASEGCVYDSFDAIAGAAKKLSADGADPGLDSAGTHAAILAYNHSEEYASEVLNRARQWERMGSAAIAPTGGGPIPGGAKGIVDEAAAIASRFGTYICSGYRPGSVTSSGFPSDHASNDADRAARDISVKGIDCIEGPPTPSLDQAAVAIGRRFGRSYGLGEMVIDTFDWHGYQIQVIWRTPLYGGHMGHIHIGARRDAGESAA